MDTISLSNRHQDRRPTYYLPLTLRDLCVLTRTEDENFVLFGVSVELVEVVCLITTWQQQTMKQVLTLQDHTARFTGVIYTRSEDKVPTSLRDYVKDSNYASVFGRLIKFADTPLLSVLKVRNVDYDEVQAHRARSLHLVCTLRRKDRDKGDEGLKADILALIGNPQGVLVAVLAEKLRKPQEALRSELFSLLERGQISMKHNRVYKA